jgi:uncharacterized membrane protein YjjP (DUF1212 family)
VPPSPSDPAARIDDGIDPAAVEFVLRLARALHGYGESAQRLEDIVVAIAERLGLPNAQFFSQPTGIQAAFGPLGRQHTHMLRVTPGAVNLGKFAEIDRVALDVARGRLAPDDGAATIARIATAPSPYGPALTTLAFALASGSACQFLGGGWREVLVATVLGFGLGLLDALETRRPRLGGVFEPLASFLVRASAVALAHVVGPLSVFVATLAGLIVLVPGLTLTTALNELASRHLASGTARLNGAFITFLAIAFGVALGNRVGAAAFGAPPVAQPIALHGWPELVSLVVSPLCFMVILRAEWREAVWIVAAGAIGVEAGRIGAATLGVELGAFAGAFAVAVASRLYERWRHRPAATVLVPGLLLLVPGTVGFRSLTSLMDRQVLAGIQAAFSAMLTAVALVAGLLVAGVVAPESRLREIRTR